MSTNDEPTCDENPTCNEYRSAIALAAEYADKLKAMRMERDALAVRVERLEKRVATFVY